MDPEVTTDTDTTTETQASAPEATAPPETPAERTFTQSDVDRIVAERLARAKKPQKSNGRQKAQRTHEADAPAPTNRAFDRQLGRANLNAAQESMLEMMWERAPAGTDPSEWVPAQCKMLGLTETVTPTTTEQKTETAAIVTPPEVPASNGGAPAAGSKSYADTDNPLEWTRDQMDRIRADKGSVKGNRYIRERLEAYMAKVTVRL